MKINKTQVKKFSKQIKSKIINKWNTDRLGYPVSDLIIDTLYADVQLHNMSLDELDALKNIIDQDKITFPVIDMSKYIISRIDLQIATAKAREVNKKKKMEEALFIDRIGDKISKDDLAKIKQRFGVI
jgi:hypothetical protein